MQQIKPKVLAATVLMLAIAVIVANYPTIKSKMDKALHKPDYQATFSKVYDTKHWGEGSGAGSNPIHAANYIELLQAYVKDPRFKTIVDLGCGDWQIMSQIQLPRDKMYQGYDVVPNIINMNTLRYTGNNVHFHLIENLRELKEKNITGDLLIVKDVLQHLPISEINYFVKNILPNFKYALITNDFIVDSGMLNADIELGQYRALDLFAAPFNVSDITTVLEYAGPEYKRVQLYTNPKFIG